MKAEIVGALLHRPQVLFLDEPTIGLDVTMQKRIRAFVAEYNERYGATVLLTSHYMADVEALCKRVVVIHHGRILFDGDLRRSPTVRRLQDDRRGARERAAADLSAYGEVIRPRRRLGHAARRRRPRRRRSRRGCCAEQPVADLTVEDPPIEDVIELVFAQERPSRDDVASQVAPLAGRLGRASARWSTST